MLSTSPNIKLPKVLPIWACKASWSGTSITYLIPAKSEGEAHEKAWKKIAKTEGGDLCLRVDVIRRVE